MVFGDFLVILQENIYMNVPKSVITRTLFINVARELFAQKGKDNVTMNDIAVLAGKVRRTIYDYFNNKNEVYTAVIENEMNIIIKKLEEIMAMTVAPHKKLEIYIFTRFETIKEVVFRNGSLKADFFKDIQEVEKARRPIDMKEIKMLRQIIDEGIADGSFKGLSSQWTAMFMLYALKGMEAPYMNSNVATYANDRRQMIMDVVLNGLLKKD